jgi:hypothetical protein
LYTLIGMDQLDQVRAVLSHPQVNHAAVARGVGCTRKWLYKLREGITQDPPARKLAALHAYLVEHYPSAVSPPPTDPNLPDGVGASPRLAAGPLLPARALK